MEIVFDEKALELKKKMPDSVINMPNQTEYTNLESACRAFNLDNEIREFIKRNHQGTIVNLGAGLETTFFRVDNGDDGLI